MFLCVCAHVQEELQRLQELSAALASLEEHLRVWQQRLQVQADPQVSWFILRLLMFNR